MVLNAAIILYEGFYDEEILNAEYAICSLIE